MPIRLIVSNCKTIASNVHELINVTENKSPGWKDYVIDDQ